MRATERLGILIWLALLLAFRVSGQSIQPTLERTMTFIANTLNSRGIVSWTTTIDNMVGAKYKSTNSLEQVNADPSTGSLAWTNIEIEVDSHHKTVDTYLVQLQAVLDIDVQSYSRNMASEDQWKTRFSPETYLVQIRTSTAILGQRQSYQKDKLQSKTSLPNNHEAKIQFADEQTADGLAEAIRQAAGLCGANMHALNAPLTENPLIRIAKGGHFETHYTL